ncbi:MAG: bifunctional (p)ppGpp synthetase/guanosine-3',5'-bis(diphosphate) 3'-pyrophosphohydrolase [Paludibacteraceae bacterium]|nr:bifunctional (p)ppGpp synthetase/guanosine-3',5'-bis(diphosphate) 3'-pyrophosphohydrolase [Paludibacteraceae bacterium]
MVDNGIPNETERADQAFRQLMDDYLASSHGKKVEIITKAYHFALNAHRGIRRLSGEPYIMHPLAVAQIVCKDIGLGSSSICAALLHDVVEDTDYTIEDIQGLFGDKIAQLVDGLTKISGGVFGEHASEQAENFRKFIITMSEDVRVALIKMADRLHNMRTLSAQPKNKQYKIAGETEYIYAPLAHRLGLSAIKTELENLCFKYNHPQEYQEIESRLEAERDERMRLYGRFAQPIRAMLDQQGYTYTMKERIKSVYSIWMKMQNKHVTYNEVYDILGARIVFEPKSPAEEKLDCWQIYNLITQIYRPHPERTRDWISTPKANGYEALHVTVMGPEGKWIEVQIRSRRMDDVAEKGLAAHWLYKKDYDSSESKIDEWLGTVKELLKNPDSDAMQFLDDFKLTLFDSEIFVFTPAGDMKTIPSGSTALDFAFVIHSKLGMHCIGAKVNNQLRELSYVLESGDQVEILTAQHAHPEKEWLDYVTTPKAKERIKAYLNQSVGHYRQEGDKLLRAELEKLGIHVKQNYSSDVEQSLLSHYHVRDLDNLLIQIGEGHIKPTSDELSGFLKIKNKVLSVRYWLPSFLQSSKDQGKGLVAEDHILADCCKPIPGDDIIGFIDEVGQIVIHKRDCREAARIKAEQGLRIVDADWTYTSDHHFNATLEVRGIDRPRMLLDIVSAVSDRKGADIKTLTIDTHDGIFQAKIVLYVRHTDDLKAVRKEIADIPDVKHITRINEA